MTRKPTKAEQKATAAREALLADMFPDPPCPMCSRVTPDFLLCEHDDPMCTECCVVTHPRQCGLCYGAGVLDHYDRPDKWGYPTNETCPECAGTGRLNERENA